MFGKSKSKSKKHNRSNRTKALIGATAASWLATGISIGCDIKNKNGSIGDSGINNYLQDTVESIISETISETQNKLSQQ